MFDFSKMAHNLNNYRMFSNSFLSFPCASKTTIPLPLAKVTSYQPFVSSSCDVTFNEPVLLYSHDIIENLGHTISDYMNVWLMLWLSNHTRDASSNVTILNVDSLTAGNNFNDESIFGFFTHYEKSFKRIIKGKDFMNKRVCISELLIPPEPLIPFVWEGRFFETSCPTFGPSTLFQRWNIHVRKSYQFINEINSDAVRHHTDQSDNFNIVHYPHRLNVLIIQRTKGKHEKHDDNNRRIGNLDEIMNDLGTIESASLNIVAYDLGKIPFEDQMRVIANSSIIIGIHGAGISSSLHMSIGSPFCCGVIEMFSSFGSEFREYQFYSNSIRKMGIHYSRMDYNPANRNHVPMQQLHAEVERMVDRVLGKPSCVHPSVVDDLYFDQ